jgi:hypothetical protein
MRSSFTTKEELNPMWCAGHAHHMACRLQPAFLGGGALVAWATVRADWKAKVAQLPCAHSEHRASNPQRMAQPVLVAEVLWRRLLQLSSGGTPGQYH